MKGLNRRHSVILEMLYYHWISEEMWMCLQGSQSCWTKRGPFENATVRYEQRTYNKSVFLFWSYWKVCLDYKTISNCHLLWVRLKLPGNHKNPLCVQIHSTIALVVFFFLSLKNNVQIVKIMTECKSKLYPQTRMESVVTLILIWLGEEGLFIFLSNQILRYILPSLVKGAFECC